MNYQNKPQSEWDYADIKNLGYAEFYEAMRALGSEFAESGKPDYSRIQAEIATFEVTGGDLDSLKSSVAPSVSGSIMFERAFTEGWQKASFEEEEKNEK